MSPSRGARLTITCAVALTLVIGAAFAVDELAGGGGGSGDSYTPPRCTAGNFELDTEQASVAATMVAAVNSYRTELPARASVLVLAAALQESKLTNIAPGEGDRDSVGVLQQRPSQDWGKVKGGPNTIADRTRRLQDVSIATREFLDKLVQLPNWQKLPAATAIQRVQISADGSLYAQHEPLATAFADALSGRTAAGINCEFEPPTQVASATRVAALASKELDIDTPVARGTGAVRVPGASWQTAAWFVANADRLGIDRVDYAGRTWTRADGWARSKAGRSAVIATMAKTD